MMDSQLSWEIIGTGVTIIGAMYIFTRDIKADSKSIKTDMKEQMSKFEDRMETIDTRWASLFEKFHILDKDMEKFRVSDKNAAKP